MELKDKYSLKEALQIIAKHMKDLVDKSKQNSDTLKTESDKKK